MENTNIDVLQTELEFYRQNQTIVEQEIRTLISDNQKLSQQVGSLIKEKLETARNVQENDQSKELEEMKKQTTLTTKERDSLYVLWQTSQKTIEALETELKTYQGYDGKNKQDITNEKHNLELKLETSLGEYIELESKYKELFLKHNVLENELKESKKEITTYKERGKEVEDKLADLNKTLEEYKINLTAEKKNNEDIKNQLALCQKECVNIIKKEAEAKTKVAEALQLFDVVSAQKNEAHKKIAELAGELSHVKVLLENVKHETECHLRRELDEVKEKYNEKITDMLEHIRNLDGELVEKGLLLNKTIRDNNILRAANESYLKQQQDCNKAVNPKLALAEQRLEAMFQELVLSERRNIQLVCEKQCLAIDIQRIQDNHTREIKRRDWEEKLMKNQCEELKMQVEHLQKSLDETHDLVNKLQNMLTSRTELSQKMVTTKEEELTELNKHLDKQILLSKKWKKSYMEMTEKINKRMADLQKENKGLRAKLNMPYISSSSLENSCNS